MTPDERAALRSAWLADLDAEIERRRATALEAAGGDPREQLLAVLEQMGQRMRAAPDWVEPTPDEQAQSARALDVWFREHRLRPLSLHRFGYFDRAAKLGFAIVAIRRRLKATLPN